MNAREKVADLWDGVIADWTPGQANWPGGLQEWFESYKGKGPGALDLGQYPDPWVGDLRGVRAEPRLVVLGLNPGVGYNKLQGAGGTWTERIRAESYSRCLERSPAEDPSTWRAVHGKQSAYWVRLKKFAQRWLDEPTAGHQDVLNFELYPWHSPKLTAGIASPASTVQNLVFDPIAEVDVADVFALALRGSRSGRSSTSLCSRLGGRAATLGRRRTANGPSRSAVSRRASGWWSRASRVSAGLRVRRDCTSSVGACPHCATPDEPPRGLRPRPSLDRRSRATRPQTWGQHMKNDFDIRYDRTLSSEFLAHFEPGGFAARIVDFAKSGLFPLDLRPRRDAKSSAQHMTLYTGLTAVLQVKTARDGQIKLDAHRTHRKVGGFDDAWAKPRPAAEWLDLWPEVELYLERVIPAATQSHGRTEGAVQAAVGSLRGSSRLVLDREVTPSFRDSATKKKILDDCSQPILKALRDADLGFGGLPKSLGAECDALALDTDGRILAIEIKPLAGGSIQWVPAQALMYARVLQRWVDADPDQAKSVLTEMAAQRRQLQLAPTWDTPLAIPLQVVPVVAVQRGASAEAISRMRAVAKVLESAGLGGPEIELLEVSLIGELLPFNESRSSDGTPKAIGASYAVQENNRGIDWKQKSKALPEEARVDEGAPYLLPEAYAKHNLLPEVREPTLALFGELGIPWHQSTDGGPSRHLRSSQVQCVNALGQMVTDPARTVAAFGGQLDIAEVRDFGEIDPSEAGRLLTFEFIGVEDYLSEGRRGKRTRGSKSTSVDAAFAYRTSAGVNELALVEWKFTETYPSAGQKAEKSLKERTRRYGDLIRDPESPIDDAGVDFSDLFHEPIYQLVRQQLFAWQLEQDPKVPASVVRVVHVLAPENRAYQRSYIAPALRDRGHDVDSVWGSLLTRPDRFVRVDPAVFLDPAVTSDEYVARYGGASS